MRALAPPSPQDRFGRLPAYLAERSRAVRLGPNVPALLAHPDWKTSAPVVLWMHGRTVNKELDPGRYLRWIRAGIAACAIDLPGHGERAQPGMDSPARTLDVLEGVLPEIDAVLESLADPSWGGGGGGGGVFDLDRVAIGGMSAGGMATLRRLCEPHDFRCATVEATAGDFGALYHGDRRWPVAHDPARVQRLNPMSHLEGWRPIPLLQLQTEADQVVPFAAATGFIDALRTHYAQRGADGSMIELAAWPQTGAPDEHAGFGRFSNDAKNRQTDFLVRVLKP